LNANVSDMVVKINRREKYQYMGTRPHDIKHKKGKHILVGWRFFLKGKYSKGDPCCEVGWRFS
jgi:hypothetical protein